MAERHLVSLLLQSRATSDQIFLQIGTSVSRAPSLAFLTVGPSSGITNLKSLPFSSSRESFQRHYHSPLPRSSAGPGCPEAGPLRPPPGTLRTRSLGSCPLQLHKARPSHYAVLLDTELKVHPSVLETFCHDTEHVLNGAKKFKWEEIIA